MDGVLLDATGVQKSFGSVVALRDASVRVSAGSVHALMGGNGSGKSTLAKTLLGVVVPDAGTLRFDGHDVEGGGPSVRSRLGLVGTYQETALADDLTVEENILINDLPRRLGLIASPRGRRPEVIDVLDQVGLPASTLARKVRELALDERCLVELARVLRSRPRLLILDELTASLRREQVVKVGELLQRLRADGTGVLFVSHRLEEIVEMCDCATVLRNGRTVQRVDSLSGNHLDGLLASMTGEAVEEGASARRRRSGAVGPTREVLLDAREIPVPGFGATASLNARAGEIVGIAGLSGNGQSELLKALFGSTGPTGGRVRVQGRETTVRTVRDAVRLGLAYVSGEREREMAFGQRSVNENLSVAGTALRRPVDPRPVMDRLKLVAHRRSPMRALSGGNQQKVILGRWLALRPTVVLADDPTRGVDVSTRNEIHMLLRELVAEGSSCVVIASSDDLELAELCDRVYVLQRGEVISELAGDQVSDHRISKASLVGGRPPAGAAVPGPADDRSAGAGSAQVREEDAR